MLHKKSWRDKGSHYFRQVFPVWNTWRWVLGLSQKYSVNTLQNEYLCFNVHSVLHSVESMQTQTNYIWLYLFNYIYAVVWFKATVY